METGKFSYQLLWQQLFPLGLAQNPDSSSSSAHVEVSSRARCPLVGRETGCQTSHFGRTAHSYRIARSCRTSRWGSLRLRKTLPHSTGRIRAAATPQKQPNLQMDRTDDKRISEFKQEGRMALSNTAGTFDPEHNLPCVLNSKGWPKNQNKTVATLHILSGISQENPKTQLRPKFGWLCWPQNNHVGLESEEGIIYSTYS